MIENTFTKLAYFESQNIITTSLKQNEHNEIYKTKEETFFQSFIDNSLKEEVIYPTKQMFELINFIESRRVKSIELTIALIAAILGGIFGSAITSLFDLSK